MNIKLAESIHREYLESTKPLIDHLVFIYQSSIPKIIIHMIDDQPTQIIHEYDKQTQDIIELLEKEIQAVKNKYYKRYPELFKYNETN